MCIYTINDLYVYIHYQRPIHWGREQAGASCRRIEYTLFVYTLFVYILLVFTLFVYTLFVYTLFAYILYVQPIAFEVSYNLNLQSQSPWSLFNGTW